MKNSLGKIIIGIIFLLAGSVSIKDNDSYIILSSVGVSLIINGILEAI